MENRMEKSDQPTVYVIAGPNGAGKTTFSSEFLPDFVQCKEFLNADLIAAGLSPFAPETQAMRAGRLLLSRIHELVEQKRTFAFETTLAGRGYVRLLANMKTRGSISTGRFWTSGDCTTRQRFLLSFFSITMRNFQPESS